MGGKRWERWEAMECGRGDGSSAPPSGRVGRRCGKLDNDGNQWEFFSLSFLDFVSVVAAAVAVAVVWFVCVSRRILVMIMELSNGASEGGKLIKLPGMGNVNYRIVGNF